jgi:ATP-binding cassette subfamily C protein EexD
MLQVYDRVLTSGSGSTLLMLSLIVLLLLATMAVLEWVRSQILVRVSERLDGLLGERLYDLSFRQALATGGRQSQAQPLHDLQGLRQFLTGPGLIAFFDAPWLPVYCLVMFAFHPWYGWLCVLAAVLLVCIAIANERSTSALLIEANRESAAGHAAVGRTLGNAEAIEALGMLGNLRKRWRARSRRVLAAQTRASERGGRWTTLSRMLRLTMQSAMLGVGAWLVLANEMTPGIMVAGSILLGRALAPVDQLTGVWKQFIGAREQYRRLNEWLGRVPPLPERMALPTPAGRIAVENVTVVPPGGKAPALRGVSFEVLAGEVVGIVGPSASGKSTLARTLLGVWPAMHGTVRLDGANVYGWNREELGPHVGYLPQDVELFDGSIAENIARFGNVASDDVVAAARLAGIHEMILRMPQGYDHVIGVNGGVLSGGQRQRVGLARAVYGRPKLVVLDEPNASLDEAGDEALLAALRTLKQRGTTIVIISHRPNLLAVVDKIAALNDGQLTAFGPRDRTLALLSGARQAEVAAHQTRAGAPQVVPIRATEGQP